MLTLTGLLTEYMDVCHDDSAENKARGIRRINELQRQLCSGKDYWWLEKIYTTVTVASTQTYNFPIDYRKLKTATITVGSIAYPLEEITDLNTFNELNSRGTSITSDFPRYFHIRNGKITVYPTPSSSSNTITIEYLKRTKDLKTEDYTTGSISVTNGSATVTGSGTTWNTANNIRAGNFIFIDDLPYEVLTVGGTTSITLTQVYQGTTASGLTYKIGDVSPLLEDFHDLLWKSAAKDYFSFGKENTQMYTQYMSEILRLTKDLKNASNSKSTSNVIPPRKKIDSYNYFYNPSITA